MNKTANNNKSASRHSLSVTFSSFHNNSNDLDVDAIVL